MTENITKILSVHVFEERHCAATGSDIAERVNNQDGLVYVFYSHPSVYVAEQLRQAKDGSQACLDWLAGASELINAHRKNRRRIKVICIQDALAHPGALQHQTGISTSSLAEFKAKSDGLNLMAANQLVLQNQELCSLLERVEASTMHLVGEVYKPVIDVRAILSEVNKADQKLDSQYEEIERLLVEREEFKSELVEKDTKIHDLSEWCKKHEQRQADLKQQLTEAEALKQKLTLEIEQMTQSLNDTQTVLDTTEQQLAERQQQLEAIYHEKQQAEENRQQESLKVKELQKWCKIHEERQGELKSELANVISAQQALENENAALRQQLDTSAEERKSLQKDLEAVKSEATANEQRVAQWQQQKQALEFQLAQALDDVKAHYYKNKEKQADVDDKPSTVQAHTTDAEANGDVQEHRTPSLLGRIKRRFSQADKKQSHIKAEQEAYCEQIKSSGLFDSEWYLATYPDVAEANADPVEHFLLFGGFEGRDPGPNFDTQFYLEQYPDVEAEGINPLVHYILYGKEEGRQVTPQLAAKS